MHGQLITSLLISLFYHLYYNVISLTGLIITLPLCLLLSFFHNKRLVSIMHERSIILHLLICFQSKYNKSNMSKNHTSTFVYYLIFAKMEFHFYLEKNWSGQNQSSRTISAGPDVNASELNDNCTIQCAFRLVLQFSLTLSLGHLFTEMSSAAKS